MKEGILSQVQKISELLNKYANIAETLPSGGPAPSFLQTYGTGEIQYDGGRKFEVAKVFGTEGWKRDVNRHSKSVDYVKTLPSGVVIRIYAAEMISDPDPGVSPSALEPQSTHSLS